MSDPTLHYRRLEAIYRSGPINRSFFPESALRVDHGSAEITLPVGAQFFHAMQAMHGAVYFKLMDDAAYFACNSLVQDVMVLTSRFEVQLLKPVTGGILHAVGTCTQATGPRMEAEAHLFCDGIKVATGVGTFARSKIAVPVL